jgi:hypothetical protein
MLRYSLGLLVFLAASPAIAQQPAAKTPYTFPQKIGIAQLVNTEDFEAKQPGQGQVGRYTFQGWTMSMFVYDAGRNNIAAAPDAAQSRQELDVSAAGLLELQTRGQFAKIEEGAPFAIPPMAKPPIFHCRSFIIQPGAEAAKAYERYICLTTSRGRFIKVFVQSTTPPGDQATVFTPVAAALEVTGRMLQR